MKENQAPTTSDGCDEERPHEGFVASVRTGRQDESAEEEPNVIATADGQESKLEHCESLGTIVGDDVGGNVGDNVGGAVGGNVGDAVGKAVGGNVGEAVDGVVGGNVGEAVGEVVGGIVLGRPLAKSSVAALAKLSGFAWAVTVLAEASALT